MSQSTPLTLIDWDLTDDPRLDMEYDVPVLVKGEHLCSVPHCKWTNGRTVKTTVWTTRHHNTLRPVEGSLYARCVNHQEQWDMWH